MRPLDRALLPHGDAGAVHGWLTDRIVEDGLLPPEPALVAGAVPGRRAQFASARRCARAALEDLGRPAVPILHDGRRRPRWPAGVVGSLTHCAGLAAAVVAPSDACLGVGVDAEPAVPLPDDVVELVLSSAERRRLATWRRSRGPAETIVFSAKESAFKIFSPSTDGWLDPDQVDVAVSADGAVVADLARPLPDGRTRLSGRWAVVGRHVVTVLAAPVAGGRLGVRDFPEEPGI
ncbi:4'-phosphopantetheinyl transferase family protein [Isoptericola croceus]|uniref:4'-phosphopantetheinyl transferase family protein n=1 Tax=Isoptericola croceus TaxID=3031406 RepID=UPI0023F940AC|nr:4'-phosphopantetheinyl transferase superfamily protein [Isoptericola croceus]